MTGPERRSSCLVLICLLCSLAAVRGSLVPVQRGHPVIKHVHVLNRSGGPPWQERGYSSARLVLRLDGLGFRPDMELKFTADKLQRGEECRGHVLDRIRYDRQFLNSTVAIIHMRLVTDHDRLYTCVKAVYRTDSVSADRSRDTDSSYTVIKWLHQGDDGLVPLDISEHSHPLSNSLRAAAETESGADGDDQMSRRSGVRRSVHVDTTPQDVSPHSDNYVEPESPRIAEVQQANSQGSRAPLLRNNVLDGDGLSLYGLRLESSEAHWSTEEEDGTPLLLMGSTVVLRLFGSGFTSMTRLVLTDHSGIRGNHCEFPTGTPVQMRTEFRGNVGIAKIKMPEVGVPGTRYYLCYKVDSNSTDKHWTHFGSARYQSIKSYARILPLWVSCIIILVCLVFSSLFSGLNLGLMSLDQTDLKIIANTGTQQERKYAEAIKPVRQHGNYLLCSILLGNVMVNSTFTILLDGLTSGIVAVVASTLLIVIFGEITPQAICSRHGLAVGAKTILITKMIMGLTFPLSYPISKLLDRILGEEIGAVFTRERLKELVKLNTGSNIKTDELNIISGVLELTEKKVCDVMTRIEDVFMLSIDSVLDFETVSSIMKSGFSRIPVYDVQRTNIVTVLYIKDLALVDPDDNLPIKTVCDFYQNNCFFIFEDTPLDYIFKHFKEGSRGHMAIVHRVNNEGEGDPFYETVGIVTLEDVIEEIIQSEIVDETDVYTDNKSKRRRQQKYKDFSEFAEMSECQKVHISPQLTLATFQFLTTSVDAFKVENISENVLKRVLKQNVFFHIKVKNKDNMKKDPATIIYDQGKPADYFVLILEGRVEVTVGKESLKFESGPFTYFGTQALFQAVAIESPSGTGVSLAVTGGSGGGSSMLGSLQSVIQVDAKQRQTFVPDYSVRAVTELFYLKLPRSLYMAAKRATLLQLSRKSEEESSSNVDTFDDVFEKLIHNLDGEDSKSQGTPEVVRTSSQVSARGSPLNNGGLVLTSSEPVLTTTSQAQPQPPSTKNTMQEECAKLLNND